MAPDLNSLPPSRPPSGSNTPLPIRIMQTTDPTRAQATSPPTPHSPNPNHSLAATAAMNAQESRRSSQGSTRRDADHARRRRSSIRMNLNLNDPSIPGPGELQMSPSMRSRNPAYPSPHHERAPSLGELHQELENEQEAQVNRLLGMIRQQQAQITTLSSVQTTSGPGASAVDDSTPTSEQSMSLPQSATQQSFSAGIHVPPSPLPVSPLPVPLGGHERSRNNSRSPSLRARGPSRNASNEWLSGSASSRDESAFYQAETQMLTRENQMLKLRIRELERQLSELGPSSPNPHAPATASNLVTSPPLEAQDGRLHENLVLPPPASAASNAAT